MQLVPLAAVPSQQFSITLGGQNCSISVYQKTTGVYFDMAFNGLPFTSAVRCLDRSQLCADRQYLGFSGDFVFIDTQGDSDPAYAGLGTRFQLIYVTAAEIEAGALTQDALA